MCVRPTSETLFCDFYKDEIQSYRDLPKVYNQWCSVVRWVRGLIYDRPNHDNFNVHGYEEQGSTTTPYDMVRVNNIDRYELQAEALRMIDADKYADKINELEAFRQEAFQFAVDNGYDHPDYTDWVYSGVNTNKQGAVSATAATAGDNE